MKEFGDINFDFHVGRLQQAYEDLLEKNRKLKLENEELKSGVFESSEIQKLKEEKEKYRQDCLRGFPITEEQQKMIREWQLKHEAEIHGRKTLEDRLRDGGAIGGKYFYRHIPTSIGIVGEIVCDECGQSFCFEDLW